jgi:pyridoxamine 5'-phosphate oxidase
MNGERRTWTRRTDYDRRAELTEQATGDRPHRNSSASGWPRPNAWPNRTTTRWLLATVGSASISNRVVLLRAFSDEGLVFHTNYNSRKAMDLERDPRAAITFFWPRMQRQVRIEGKAGRS